MLDRREFLKFLSVAGLLPAATVRTVLEGEPEPLGAEPAAPQAPPVDRPGNAKLRIGGQEWPLQQIDVSTEPLELAVEAVGGTRRYLPGIRSSSVIATVYAPSTHAASVLRPGEAYDLEIEAGGQLMCCEAYLTRVGFDHLSPGIDIEFDVVGQVTVSH